MLELDPSVAEEVARGINNDGSNLSGVSARCSWAEHANPSYIVSVLTLYKINILSLWRRCLFLWAE
jgi:Suppressor of Fused Gli/Ci N terminal binding domain